jgi:glyoxylase-like metal-dependent hydrolase (beta-lactamase superfamily II)
MPQDLSRPVASPGGVWTRPGRRRTASFIDDVEERRFGALPDATWVHLGHGEDTTPGARRPHLAEWRARG